MSRRRIVLAIVWTLIFVLCAWLFIENRAASYNERRLAGAWRLNATTDNGPSSQLIFSRGQSVSLQASVGKPMQFSQHWTATRTQVQFASTMNEIEFIPKLKKFVSTWEWPRPKPGSVYGLVWVSDNECYLEPTGDDEVSVNGKRMKLTRVDDD